MRRFWLTLCGCLLLIGCAPETPAPDQQRADSPKATTTTAPRALPAPTPASSQTGETVPATRDWVIGSWSYADSCETDFVVHYRADGTVDNYGEIGTWRIDGDTLTERTTERYEMGDDVAIKLDPSETVSYIIRRIDEKRGEIVIGGKTTAILRC